MFCIATYICGISLATIYEKTCLICLSLLIVHLSFISFLAWLHFSAEELLLYPWRPHPRPCPHYTCVRYTCKILGQMYFDHSLFFSCILTLFIVLTKPLATKAHNSRAYVDCGTFGASTQIIKTRSNCRQWTVDREYWYFIQRSFLLLYLSIATMLIGSR